MYIHAFDPGESTGFAVLQVEARARILHIVATDVFTIHKDFDDWHTTTAVLWKPKIVVIEAFRLYAFKAQSQIGSYFPSAEYAGIIKYLCWLRNLQWIEQMASCKFPFANLKTIKEVIPDFEKPKTEHEIDAIRHGLYWWFNTGIKK
jgi:hypothetical protein